MKKVKVLILPEPHLLAMIKDIKRIKAKVDNINNGLTIEEVAKCHLLAMMYLNAFASASEMLPLIFTTEKINESKTKKGKS